MDTTTTGQQSEYHAWHPPSYHVASNATPVPLSRTLLELDPDLPENFPRTAKWCGDGSCLMVQCENRSFQTFTACARFLLSGLAADEVDITKVQIVGGVTIHSAVSKHPTAPFTSLAHFKTFIQPAPIVDFAWYPGASQHTPPSFCFVASVRDCPVKLLDARDGRLRASYPIVDHRERYVAPHSLAFNLGADRLYAGFEDAIEIFDVQRPGEGERLHTTPSKKSKDGLKGIVAALAFSRSPGYYAAGSFTPASRTSDNIALFDESAMEPVASMGGMAGREKGGVTQLMFNPTRPHILYAAFRRSERIWSWDLRGDPSVPLCYFARGGITSKNGSGHENTNQKRQFDVEASGRWLACGNQLGQVAMYDLEKEGDEQIEGEVDETMQGRSALVFDAHDDAIGAVAFHPLEPRLLSASGSRHFDDRGDLDLDSESSDGSDEENGRVVSRLKERARPSARDASIRMWDFREPVM